MFPEGLDGVNIILKNSRGYIGWCRFNCPYGKGTLPLDMPGNNFLDVVLPRKLIAPGVLVQMMHWKRLLK